jgi:quercetin 2,3-dioxygenase
LDGEAVLEGDKSVSCIKSTTVVFKPDDTSKFRVTGGKIKSCKFILLAGKPLNEPIERYGPFVMNTEEEINEAFNDYKTEKNGFEGARSWQSTIKNLAKKKK